MASDKYFMVNIIGPLEDVNPFTKDVFLFSDLNILNAMEEIEAGRYVLPVIENNIEALRGFSELTTIPPKLSRQKKFEETVEMLEKFFQNQLIYDLNLVDFSKLDADLVLTEVDDFLKSLTDELELLEQLRLELKQIQDSILVYSYLKDIGIDIPMEELDRLRYFSYSIGSLTPDNATRLKVMYPSVPAVLFHIGESPENEQIYMVVYANDFKQEAERILRSLDYRFIEGLNKEYTKTPEEIVKELELKKVELTNRIEKLEVNEKVITEESKAVANNYYSQILLLEAIEKLKLEMAFSTKNFYFSVLLPIQSKEKFEQILSQYPGVIALFENADAKFIQKPKEKHRFLRKVQRFLKKKN